MPVGPEYIAAALDVERLEISKRDVGQTLEGLGVETAVPLAHRPGHKFRDDFSNGFQHTPGEVSVGSPGLILLQRFTKSSSTMCPATNRKNPFLVFVDIVHSITISLDYTLIILKQLQCYLLCPGTMVIMEEDQVPHYRSDHPDVTLYCLMLFIIDYRDCGLIALDIV